MIDEDEECQNCKKPRVNLECSACEVVRYCGKECQLLHWRKHHKKYCEIERYLKEQDAYGMNHLVALPNIFHVVAPIDEEYMTASYSEAVEETFFTPSIKKLNDLYILNYRRWNKQLYVIISTPIADSLKLKSVAFSMGFELNSGKPGTDFPMTDETNDNIYTLKW